MLQERLRGAIRNLKGIDPQDGYASLASSPDERNRIIGPEHENAAAERPAHMELGFQLLSGHRSRVAI
jgi:hypothetical protein